MGILLLSLNWDMNTFDHQYMFADLTNRDCQWSNWSKCSTTCGKGTQTRYKEVHATNRGQECTGHSTQECHIISCLPIPGEQK